MLNPPCVAFVREMLSERIGTSAMVPPRKGSTRSHTSHMAASRLGPPNRANLLSSWRASGRPADWPRPVDAIRGARAAYDRRWRAVGHAASGRQSAPSAIPCRAVRIAAPCALDRVGAGTAAGGSGRHGDALASAPGRCRRVAGAADGCCRAGDRDRSLPDRRPEPGAPLLGPVRHDARLEHRHRYGWPGLGPGGWPRREARRAGCKWPGRHPVDRASASTTTFDCTKAPSTSACSPASASSRSATGSRKSRRSPSSLSGSARSGWRWRRCGQVDVATRGSAA